MEHDQFDRFIAEQGCHTGAHARSWHVGELALHTALVAVELLQCTGESGKAYNARGVLGVGIGHGGHDVRGRGFSG